MKSPRNLSHLGIPDQPTNPHEQEALTLLKEECAELIQEASKILRVGPNFIPYDDGTGTKPTFRERLVQEMGDVRCLIEECIKCGLVTEDEIQMAHAKKRHKLAKWTRYLGDV